MPGVCPPCLCHGAWLLVVALSACAAPAPEARSAASPDRKPAEVEVPRTIVTPDEALGVDELYARGQAEFGKEEWENAARTFDRLSTLDPDGPHGARALFYAGWAHDNAGNNAEALARYEQVARRFPKDDLARSALVRAVRLLTHAEEWARAGAVSDLLLEQLQALGPLDRIVAYSGKALALLATKDVDAAEPFIERGRGIVEKQRLDSAGQVPPDLARLFFALGELRRARGERIQFDPVPEDFATVLERRCRLLLDAQSAYSDAMRAYDAHWSAMAGYRVGELYQRLHRDLLAVPPPRTADSDSRLQLFRGAMRLRYAVLLDKGLAMMTHTLDMAERTGERSAWISRARDAKVSMDKARDAEQAALAALPYTREQLEKALSDLSERAAKQAPGTR
jgi:tetratricopeptide (TPR) repeat protein